MKRVTDTIIEHADAIGKVARVHWNLHRDAISVKCGSAPVFLCAQIQLQNCTFLVDARLRAQFESRPSRRTVHALVRGTIVGFSPVAQTGERVRCNPFRYRGFVRADDEVGVSRADFVAIHADRTITAEGLVAEG